MSLPGLRGTEHIGFTVPDLDQAERFFVDVIGCEMVYSLGPFIRQDDWMSTQLNVHPRSRDARASFLSLQEWPQLKSSSGDRRGQNPQPKNSDIVATIWAYTSMMTLMKRLST